MTDFQFPLLIASIDSGLQLSFPQQAQSFFSSSDIKPSSPTIVITCFNSTSTLFPNLFNSLLSSCSITLPTTPGIWLRHLFQQPVVSKSSSVASPPRDGNSGQVALILDVVTAGLNHVRAPSPFTLSRTRSHARFVPLIECNVAGAAGALVLAGLFIGVARVGRQRRVRAVLRLQLCNRHRSTHYSQRPTLSHTTVFPFCPPPPPPRASYQLQPTCCSNSHSLCRF